MTDDCQQRERYARQLLLDEIGESGQRRLCKSKAMVIGAGGLGSAAAYYLAAAGVGTIGVMDSDVVELSNLNRQILHATADLGHMKVDTAAESIRRLNRNVRVYKRSERFTAVNAVEVLRDFDVVVDGLDNFASKWVLHDTCVSLGIPFVHAGATGWSGQWYAWAPGLPCLRCVLGKAIPVEEPQYLAIMGAVSGVIGVSQALAAVWLLLRGAQSESAGVLSHFDGVRQRWVRMRWPVDEKCACARSPQTRRRGY